MLNTKSKLLYLEHLLLKKLITEQEEKPSGSNIEGKIINAMKFNRKRNPPGIPVCKFNYEAPDDPSGGKVGYRDVEIFALGTNKWKNRVIYAWLRNDTSKTLNAIDATPHDKVRWRMFRLDGISDFKYTIQNIDTSDAFIAANRPKLNKLFNKALTDVTTIFTINKKK